MKYIRRFNENSIDIESELNDILVEINDDPNWKTRCWEEPETRSWVIIIETIFGDGEYDRGGQAPPECIDETIERCIDFMGSHGYTEYQITLEMDEGDTVMDVDIDDVSKLDIWPSAFIKVEFSQGYLKQDNIKRFNESSVDIESELNDILLEINDEPNWKAKCWKENSNFDNPMSGESLWTSWFIIIQTIFEDDYKRGGESPPPIIKETIERCIDFMGSHGYTEYKITFEAEYDNISTDDEKRIDLEDISELDVWSNNFIRIEFW